MPCCRGPGFWMPFQPLSRRKAGCELYPVCIFQVAPRYLSAILSGASRLQFLEIAVVREGRAWVGHAWVAAELGPTHLLKCNSCPSILVQLSLALSNHKGAGLAPFCFLFGGTKQLFERCRQEISQNTWGPITQEERS